MKHIYLLTLFVSVFGCTIAENKKKIPQKKIFTPHFIRYPIGYAGSQHENVTGTWTNAVMMYTQKLDLKENGTFVYHSWGCLGESHTEGVWYKTGNAITLNSYKTYKDSTESHFRIISTIKPGTDIAEIILPSDSSSTDSTLAHDTVLHINTVTVEPMDFYNTITIAFDTPTIYRLYFENEKYIIQFGNLKELSRQHEQDYLGFIKKD